MKGSRFCLIRAIRGLFGVFRISQNEIPQSRDGETSCVYRRRVPLATAKKTWDKDGMSLILVLILVAFAVAVGIYFAFGRG